MVNYKAIVGDLQKYYSDATHVVVVSRTGKIMYSTENWDVASDISAVLKSWASVTAQSVTLNGIRYSILQMEPERFIATNRQDKGHLVGAAIPDEDIFVVAQIHHKAKGWFHMAYPTVARAAAAMKKGAQIEYLGPKSKVSKKKKKKKEKKHKKKEKRGKKTEDITEISKEPTSVASEAFGTISMSQEVVPTYPSIDPNLRAEIESFLQWIRDPNGLSSYISYYLSENDFEMISKLAEIYGELYRIFYP